MTNDPTALDALCKRLDRAAKWGVSAGVSDPCGEAAAAITELWVERDTLLGRVARLVETSNAMTNAYHDIRHRLAAAERVVELAEKGMRYYFNRTHHSPESDREYQVWLDALTAHKGGTGE